jgi:hypothetical protein
MKKWTVEDIEPVAGIAAEPEFIDAKAMKERFGLSRTHAYLLTQENHIKSISIRRPGTKRGKRLWSYASVKDYLHSLEK